MKARLNFRKEVFNSNSTKENKRSMREWILLDNCSTVNMFCNRRLLSNIRTVMGKMTASTNAGKFSTKQQGDLKNANSKIWFDERAVTNILSLSLMKKAGFRTVYDSDQADIFYATKPNGDQVLFENCGSGLCRHDATKRAINFFHDVEITGVNHLNTVADNMKMFSKKQIAGAEEARALQNKLWFVSDQGFENAIRNNNINNCPTTVDDAKTAKKTHGPNVASLKGKMTRKQPKALAKEVAEEIPSLVKEEHKHATLFGDMFFINKIPFLVTLSQHLQFMTTENMPNRKVVSFQNALEHVLTTCNNRDFVVTDMRMDLEFDPLRDWLDNRNMTLDCPSAGEHVPQTERRIRTVKERIRAWVTTSPFKKTPRTMTTCLAAESCRWINSFPPSNGISKTASPRTILSGRKLDCNKHCRLAFGQHVQVYEKTANDMTSRSTGAMCLGNNNQLNGNCKFLSLTTGKTLEKITPKFAFRFRLS